MKRRSENRQKLFYAKYGEFTSNHCRKCPWRTLANRFEIHSIFYACFSRFTVGSSKTRQITIWAIGLITTNHEMRPIGLIMLEAMSSPPASSATIGEWATTTERITGQTIQMIMSANSSSSMHLAVYAIISYS